MSEQQKRIKKALQRMSEHYRKYPPQKLESDDQGRLLLDPNNPHHVEWMKDHEASELILPEHR